MANPLICIFNPISTLIDEIPSVSIGPATSGIPVVTNLSGVVDASLLGFGSLALAGETITSGQLINIYSLGGTLHAQVANAKNTGTAPSGASYPREAQGFASANAVLGALFTVNFFGTLTYIDNNTEFSAANIGQEVYLSAITAGGITLTPPGTLEQAVGYVVSFTSPNIVVVNFISGFQDFTHISGVNPISKGGTGATTAPAALVNLIGGSPATGNALIWNGSAWIPGAPLVPFNDITAATNTAALVVGTGGSFMFSGSGVIQASQIQAVIISNTPPTTGQALIATSGAAANWQAIPSLVSSGSSNNPGQVATLGPVTLVAAATGHYRVSFYEDCTVAGSHGLGTNFGSGVFGGGVFDPANDQLQTTISWTDDVGARVAFPVPPLDLGGTNATSGNIFIRAVGGTAITFTSTLVAQGSPTYGVFARTEFLS